MPYDPPRQVSPKDTSHPLEVELVFNVRPCGTCDFFWPTDSPQPYGPYPAYDFLTDSPQTTQPPAGGGPFVWLDGIIRPATFPDAEVMDGCRKAPIMTIGINPNLTAFEAGTMGADWCYPSFSGQSSPDSWAKYAYYYRYRSVYQEHFGSHFIRPYLETEGQVIAARPGVMKAAIRTSDDPSYDIRVLYDGDDNPAAIHLAGKLGQPRYVVLVDANQRFQKGDVLAARLSIPAGHKTEIMAQPVTYYLQMLPVLKSFEQFLHQQGHKDASLKVGEDVGQIDMVACASPHWGPPWLGGTTQTVNTVIANCVHKNGWAMKQLVQTQPAVVFLVGQASWNMFRQSFGHLVRSASPLPPIPEDGPYTLLQLTAAQEHRLEFAFKKGKEEYQLSARLVITPHFSYNENFVPQFRMSPQDFADFEKRYPEAALFLQHDPRMQFQKKPGSFVAAALDKDSAAVLAEIRSKFAPAKAVLDSAFYDPHEMMAGVLKGMFGKELSYTVPSGGAAGYLTRTSGPCQFCEYFKFPQGCPYGKPSEKEPYSNHFLKQAATAIVDPQHSAVAEI